MTELILAKYQRSQELRQSFHANKVIEEVLLIDHFVYFHHLSFFLVF